MNINEEMKLHKWAQDMTDQKSSGLSQKEWCSMNIPESFEPPVRTFRATVPAPESR